MSYLDRALDPSESKHAVKILIETITNSGIDFDFIAVRGMSGAILSGIVSIKLKKQIVIIRKDGENSHSTRVIEHHSDFAAEDQKFIIIDDGISSGDTIIRIASRLHQYNCECVGIFLYSSSTVGSVGSGSYLQKSLGEKLSSHGITANFPIYNENKVKVIISTNTESA